MASWHRSRKGVMSEETGGIDPSRCWLVIPLYNEAEVVAEVVRAARATFPNIVCVDDGSTDGSVNAARDGGAIVLEHVVNLGQGAALQTGIDFALTDPAMLAIVTFDADGQHRVEDALAMVQQLVDDDVDIVIGSRFLDDRTKVSAMKRIVLRTVTVAQRLSTGLRLTDAHNGLRAMTRSTASTIRITQNRMAHASEIVSEVARLKLRYAEHPVHVLYTDYSKSKGQSLWNSVNILSDMIIR